MMSLTPELEAMRGRLLDATTRDLRRSRRRAQRRVAVTVMATALVAITGVAVAADGVRSFVSNMNVFSEPGNGSASPEVNNRLQVVEDLSTEVPDSMDPGRPLGSDRGRVLLRHSEPGLDVEVYATPTTKDRVCYTAVIQREGDNAPGGGGGCVKEFSPSWPIAGTGGIALNQPAALVGITASSVEQVRVRTATGWKKAVMGADAYFWSAASVAEDPIEIEVELADGTTFRRPSDVPQTRRIAEAVVRNREQGTTP